MAPGGSTNAVLHLLAMAHAADVKLDLDDFSASAQGAGAVRSLPSGRYVATDLRRVAACRW
jgi:dihydroxy-acid dehydratase